MTYIYDEELLCMLASNDSIEPCFIINSVDLEPCNDSDDMDLGPKQEIYLPSSFQCTETNCLKGMPAWPDTEPTGE